MNYRRQKHLRLTAIFLLINFLQSIVLPPVAQALTSGPTAPEATSFEPVDTTDMVNLQTGDFTYNIPLLEVPGPEGGYPLSLSYHAGIKPLEDASWVGLGWNLNPGAINRVVNGVPDDQKNAVRTVHDWWEGGQTTTYSVGTTIGYGLGVNLYASISNDTYKGFQGNVGFGISAGIPSGPDQGLNASLNFNSNSSTPSVGIGFYSSIGEASNYINSQISISNHGIGSTTGLSFSRFSSMHSLGISMDSRSLKPSLSVAGVNIATVNGNYGRISSHSSSIGLPIPTPFGVFNISRNYIRYWMNAGDLTEAYGTLYAHSFDQFMNTSSSSTACNAPAYTNRNKSMDIYRLPDSNINNSGAGSPNDPSWGIGGSFLANDVFQVNTQGLSGTMRPHIYKNLSLIGKRASYHVNSTEHVTTTYGQAKPLNYLSDKIQFRFDNDFSNYFKTTMSSLNYSSSTSDMWCPYTLNESIYYYENAGYNDSKKHLAGSKHVDWFTNQEIRDSTAKNNGFINYHDPSSVERASIEGKNVLDQIGGFSVTNESGVTYHFTIPAYSYNEVHSTFRGDWENGNTRNTQYNDHPYAYTWLLTGITGPDFVDRGNTDGSANGVLDNEDWGYWVKFEYGKWADNYKWRTPSVGFHLDVNNASETFSYGEKEVYYLDAISTRSHTAVFVKDIRKDGKSVARLSGGFIPGYDNQPGSGNPICPELPVSSLRLDKILLFKNTTLEALAIMPDQIRANGDLFDEFQCDQTTSTVLHYSDNVVDHSDLTSIEPQWTKNALKIISFDNNHYELCAETINSIDNTNAYGPPASYIDDPKGKLTLKAVNILGRGGTSFLPPIRFEYDTPENHHDYSVISNDEISITGADNSWHGNILRYENNMQDYYLLLTEHISGNLFKYKKLGLNTPNVTHSGTGTNGLSITKNPPFNQNKVDVWGNYHSEIDGAFYQIALSNIQRHPTPVSIKSLDAWSLRSIENSLGAKINIEYEPKTYTQSVLNKKEVAKATMATNINNQLHLIIDGIGNPGDLFKVGDQIQYQGVIYCAGATLSDFKNQLFTITQIQSNRLFITPYGPPSSCTFERGAGFIDYSSFNIASDIIAHVEGIRVKEISLESNTQINKTSYEYTGGITSYIPYGHPDVMHSGLGIYKDLYMQTYLSRYDSLLQKAYFIPSPGVNYKEVKVTESANNIPVNGYKKYHFQTFEGDMLSIHKTNTMEHQRSVSVGQTIHAKDRNVSILDYTARVGSLLKHESFNQYDNLVLSTTNNYSTDPSNHNDQGIIHQEFNEVRVKTESTLVDTYIFGVVSKYESHPNFLESSTSYENGVVTTTYNRKFDFYSGEPTCVETVNHNGESYLSLSTPAYQADLLNYGNIGPGSSIDTVGMGPKVNNPQNKNMLLQSAQTTVYRSDGSGNILAGSTPLSTSVSTWSKDWTYRDYNPSTQQYEEQLATAANEQVWRKHKSYIWKSDLNSDGTYTNAPTAFVFSTPTAYQTSEWQQINEVTRYDRYSKPLEEQDIVGDFAAAKMGYDQQLVLATCTNAQYTEFAYSGAEDPIAGTDYCGGEVKAYGLDMTKAHTGVQSAKVQNNPAFVFKAKVGTDVELQSDNNRSYRASVWFDGAPDDAELFYHFEDAAGNWITTLPYGNVNGINYAVKAGDWHLLNMDIAITDPAANGQYLVVGARGKFASLDTWFDDFRFHPTDAAMTAYVYDPDTDELRFILDAYNLYTEFQYDEAGRLEKTYQETNENLSGRRLLTKNEYNYGRDQ